MSSAALPPARQAFTQRRAPVESVTPSPPRRTSAASAASPVQQPSLTSGDETKQSEGEELPSTTAEDPNLSGKQSQSALALGASTEEEKKCWICFADASEDTPETSPWRDPCPCALVAHEQCLLDWIADMEASRNVSRSLGRSKISCPQCKGAIILQRPTNPIVEAVRFMDYWSARLVFPSSLAVVSGIFMNRSFYFAIHSVYTVFGIRDGQRILRPLFTDPAQFPNELGAFTSDGMVELLFKIISYRLAHWRLYVGLNLVTPILILSRTKLADAALSMLPVAYVASHFLHHPTDTLDFSKWPETPILAFMTLPYVRAAYNAYYRLVWEKREQRWLREVLPRSEEEDEAQDDGVAAAIAQGGVAVREQREDDELEIDMPIFEEDWDDDEEEMMEGIAQQLEQQRQREPVGDGPAAEAAVPQGADGEAGQAARPPVGEAAAVGAAARPARHVRRETVISPTVLGETVIGALLFPSIAAFSGELIRWALPRSWTSSATQIGISSGVPLKTLLQHKWGRSIIGGCACVVLKDAILLYVRWKMAQLHRRRRILDFDRSKAKKGTGPKA